jgi:cysteine desulfurase
MHFPIYLDNSSTTPVDPRVAEKMMECLTREGNFGNPASRSHMPGWKAEEAVETARRHVADLINCDPREIVWTSGATEADNLAIKGAAHFYNKKGKHVITSKIEHKAVLDSCRQLEREGYEVTYLDPSESGIISPESVASATGSNTKLLYFYCILSNSHRVDIFTYLYSYNSIFYLDCSTGAYKAKWQGRSAYLNFLAFKYNL